MPTCQKPFIIRRRNRRVGPPFEREDMFNLSELVEGAETIGIAGHVRPDGDAVGSTLALYNYLKKVWPEKKVTLFLEHPAEIFADLKGFDEIQWPVKLDPANFMGEKQEFESLDLFIAMDLGDLGRLGLAGEYFTRAKTTACIDHHISNTGFGRYTYIVPTASSTSELVFELIDEDKIDVDIAKCLYTGIIHDTGVMQYSNTSRRTLEIVGKLIDFGFDFTDIIDRTFYEKTYLQNQIMGRAVMESILFMGGRCIASVVDHKVMEFYNAKNTDFEGIVNQLLHTKGVDVAIFMYESSHEQLLYKVSMRSNDKVDVSKIAQLFGGGGHKKAAGFSMTGTYHDILNNISEQIERQLNEKRN